MRLRPVGRDAHHLVLEGQLAFLQGDFFEVLGIRKVVLSVQLLESVVQLVVQVG